MTIRKTEFAGAGAVELITDALHLIAVTDFGPRIAYLGKPGENNLLLWEPEQHTRGKWDLRGGHRVWITTPGADECEDTYAPDNQACDVEILENGFRVIGAESSANMIRRGIEVTLIDDKTVSVDNFAVNTGELLYSGGIWAITCSLPKENSRYVIPLGDGSSWDTFTMVNFRTWGGHGQGGFNDPQFEIGDELLTLIPQGKENKRMLLSHQGVIAMTNPVDKVTFAKKIDYDPAGQYPMNTNTALYVGPDNFMVEMETMGPGRTLKPGDEMHHMEIWKLVDGVMEFDKGADVEELFNH